MPAPTERAIRFWFRGKIQSVSQLAPTRTILQWLREDQHAHGTKEGCGEGDCGACMVVIGSRDDTAPEGLRLDAINSCIQLLPTLDGKALFTVEDLAQGDQLHPVQAAMVEAHASQCGFCTPGFVMALWADHENRRSAPSREELCTTLSGNLCRCTGYRPILDAAQAAWKTPCGKLARQPIRAALDELAQDAYLHYRHENAHFYAPDSLEALGELYLQHPHARLLAGSTDIGLWVTKQFRNLGDIIYLGKVEALQHIRTTEHGLEIGAGANLNAAFAALSQYDAGWDALAPRFASQPVRNAGTLGGNVANGSPIGDSMPGLLTLNAEIILQRGQEVRQLALKDFYLGYQRNALAAGEFVRSIILPPAPTGLRLFFRTWKVSKRQDQDISAVCGAFAVVLDEQDQIQEVRIAYGGMAAIPKRAAQAELRLRGKPMNAESINKAMQALPEDYQPLTDMRASADYRMRVAQNLLLRFEQAYQAECPALRAGVA